MSNPDFESHFGHAPQAAAAAHGRVNLIGDHTDYCGGYVLPTLISQRLTVYISRRADNTINGLSSEFGAETKKIDEVPADSWLLFIKGALVLMNERGAELSGLNVLTISDIPAGAGVSSSAAFEIALLRALSELTNIPITAKDMALMGQRIEHEFIGTKCGIMDQMAVAMAEIGQALALDCQSLETQIMTMAEDISIAIIHTGSTRKLSASLYNTRLSETIEAAKQMGYSQLSDANIEDLSQLTDDILLRRARHVICENERVLAAKEALEAGDMLSLGELMTQSHLSLRDDYEVSSDALDSLVQTAISQGALGARLTGAGFGGCIVALMAEEAADDIIAAILEQSPEAWLVDSL
ncbi:MAG: galactokinase [Candidatus Puniceispirillaceae bacterium]